MLLTGLMSFLKKEGESVRHLLYLLLDKNRVNFKRMIIGIFFKCIFQF